MNFFSTQASQKIMIAESARKNNFDIVRLFAALLVVYGHSFILIGKTAPGLASNSVSTIGVKIFFSVSGYLVAKSWINEPHFGRFIVRRSLRIFPGLILVVSLSIVALGPLLTSLPIGAYFNHPLTWDYLHNIRLNIRYFLPGLFAENIYPNALNGNLWSLPVEFAMYIMTPIVLSVLSYKPMGKFVNPSISFFIFACAYCVIAFYFSVLTAPRPQIVIYASDLWSALQVSPYFLVGMTFAVCRFDRFLNVQAAFAACIAFATLNLPWPIVEAVLFLILPYAVLSFGMAYLPASRFLEGRDISYGLFLYSFPVQQTLVWAGVKGSGWTLFGLTLLVCVPLAYGSWVLVERPALRLKPYSGSRRFAAPDK